MKKKIPDDGTQGSLIVGDFPEFSKLEGVLSVFVLGLHYVR